MLDLIALLGYHWNGDSQRGEGEEGHADVEGDQGVRGEDDQGDIVWERGSADEKPWPVKHLLHNFQSGQSDKKASFGTRVGCKSWE